MTHRNYLRELKFEIPIKFYRFVATPGGVPVLSVSAFVEDFYYWVLLQNKFPESWSKPMDGFAQGSVNSLELTAYYTQLMVSPAC